MHYLQVWWHFQQHSFKWTEGFLSEFWEMLKSPLKLRFHFQYYLFDWTQVGVSAQLSAWGSSWGGRWGWICATPGCQPGCSRCSSLDIPDVSAWLLQLCQPGCSSCASLAVPAVPSWLFQMCQDHSWAGKVPGEVPGEVPGSCKAPKSFQVMPLWRCLSLKDSGGRKAPAKAKSVVFGSEQNNSSPGRGLAARGAGAGFGVKQDKSISITNLPLFSCLCLVTWLSPDQQLKF